MSTAPTTAGGNGSSQFNSREGYLQMWRNATAAHDDGALSKLLALSMEETERMKARLEMDREIELDANGEFVVKNLNGLKKLGAFIASTNMVPDRWRIGPNNPNAADDCAIGAQMALRLKMNVLTFLQNAYVVHGTPGVTAQVVISLLNTSEYADGIIDYEHQNVGTENERCRAFLPMKGGRTAYGPWVEWQTVVAEGWNKDKKSRNSDYVAKSKWNTMRFLMFEYRAAAFLGRTRFPQILMGLRTNDELEDVHGIDLDERTPDRPKLAVTTSGEIKVSKAPIAIHKPEHVEKEEAKPDDSQEAHADEFYGPQDEPDSEQVAEQEPAAVEPEKTTDPPVTPPVATGLDSGLVDEFRARLKMCRTADGVSKLGQEINDSRSKMRGDEWEELLELAESRRFELERKNGKSQQRNLG